MITITVARALKLKNKIVSEIKSTEDLIRTENVTEGENKSLFDVVKLLVQLTELRENLSKVKGAIAKANGTVFEEIFALSEIKAHIAFLKVLSTKDGTFDESSGYDRNPTKKIYKAAVTKSDTVAGIILLEKEIEKIQEKLDIFNHATKIDIDIIL